MLVSPVKNTKEEEHDLLKVWREQVEQAREQQQTNRALARASVEAYTEFLDSLFSYYKNVRAGNVRAGKRR